MAEKRDYYEVLGVQRERFKRRNQRCLPKTSNAVSSRPQQRRLVQKKNSKKSVKPTLFSPTTKKDKHTISLGHSGFDQRYKQEDIFRGADFDSVFRDMGFGDIFRTFFGRWRIRRLKEATEVKT